MNPKCSSRRGNKDRAPIKYCVVLGCPNTGTELQVWKRTRCKIHRLRIHQKCGCPPPFLLYPFPNSEKLRKMWLFRIGMPELEVCESTQICGIHFLDGRPTSRSFFPTLFLQENELVDGEEDGHNNRDQEDFVEEDFEPDFMEMPIIQNIFHVEPAQTDFNFHPEESSSISIALEERNGQDSSKCDHIEESLQDFSRSKQEISSTQEDGNEKNEEIQVIFQSSIANADNKTLPLIQYDPNAETLQITDPVKYIMECHRKIAQLENEKLKLAYITDVNGLKAQNQALQSLWQKKSQLGLISSVGHGHPGIG